ncbi:MAG: hypothetical protein KGJ13_11575 [Patescibacteria group bacterium]|nr:hypothetical protein [Patescibacteria group bacterium]
MKTPRLPADNRTRLRPFRRLVIAWNILLTGQIPGRKTFGRLKCETVNFTIGATKSRPHGHQIALNIGYEDGDLIEIAYATAGKTGSGLHSILNELARKTSRAIQGRNPEMGEGPIK